MNNDLIIGNGGLSLGNLNDGQLNDLRSIVLAESITRMENTLLQMQDTLVKERQSKKIFVEETNEKLDDFESRLVKTEKKTTIESKEQGILQKEISKRAYAVIHNDRYYEYFKDFSGQARNKAVRSVFPRIHRDIKNTFSVPTYKDIRKTDYDEALQFIKSWNPKLYN